MDEIVSEIRGMKPVSTDKMFIEFVDSIDKIHRDLIELDLEAEIATTNMVTEIERKLPNLVRRDWSCEFMAEDKEKIRHDNSLTFFEQFARPFKIKVDKKRLEELGGMDEVEFLLEKGRGCTVVIQSCGVVFH